MAIVSYRNKYIYLLNPRTASTATGQALRDATDAYFVPKENIKDEAGKIVVPRKHSTLRQLREHGVLPEAQIDAFFKFVTVRNPYDSIVSAWSKKRHDYAALLEDPKSWVHDIDGYADRMRRAADKDFPDWIEMEYRPKLKRGRSGSMNRNFIRGVDHVLRFETLAEDIAGIADRIGLGPDFQLPRTNVTKGRTERDYRAFYTDRARDIVSRVFAEEIETLGYSF